MRKRTQTRQPQVVKTAVVAKAVLGESKSQIARDLDITRNTVRRVLDEAEFTKFIEEGKSTLAEVIPDAARIYAEKVKSNADEAKDFLERVTVLQPKQNVNNGPVIGSFEHTIRFGDGKRSD